MNKTSFKYWIKIINNINKQIPNLVLAIHKERIKSNFEFQKITLDEDDIEKINGLNYNKRNFDLGYGTDDKRCSRFKIKG